MAQYTIFHNPRCSKSRKALELLNDKCSESDLEIIEYLDQGLAESRLKEVYSNGDFEVTEMVRPKEAKEEGVDYKSMAETEVIKAIAKNPRILQRPIVAKGSKATIARDDEWFSRL